MKLERETGAAGYDDLAARTIPDIDHFYQTIVNALPEKCVRVLELGCGTGLLTTQIRKKRPDTDVICIDSSPAMVAVARQKPELVGVSWILGDIREPWPDGQYDAVVSSFSLIALQPGEQHTVLGHACRALRPGGVCITGCVVRPPTTEEEKRQLARWETFMQDAGLDLEEIRRQRASWDGARARIPMAEGFREMLEEAGFTQVRCPYHRGLYAVFVAER